MVSEMVSMKAGDEEIAVVVAFLHPQVERDLARGAGSVEAVQA